MTVVDWGMMRNNIAEGSGVSMAVRWGSVVDGSCVGIGMGVVDDGSSMVHHGSCYHVVDGGMVNGSVMYRSVSRVGSVSRAGDNCVETVVLVGGVFDLADGAVGFHQGVFALDDISVANFMLGFVVAGVVVIYSVFEFVFGVGLKNEFDFIIIDHYIFVLVIK